jgi:hypothetical protein
MLRKIEYQLILIFGKSVITGLLTVVDSVLVARVIAAAMTGH